MAQIRSAQDHARANRRVALYALAVAAGALGLGFASVPLYRLFCQATGFQGTTNRANEAQAEAAARRAAGTVIVRFDANVERGMNWTFRPEQVSQEVKLGQRQMAMFVARNNTDHPITGRATFNVEPEQAGFYFNKIQCFCFDNQTLQPGQEVRMPVVYYVDPKIRDDENARDIGAITLSYTFHQLKSGS